METKINNEMATAEAMSVPATDQAQPVARRNMMNSVFTDLFSDPNNQLKVYQTLHPEDTEATVADIHTVTLKSVMTSHLYNDLGFTLGNRTVYLIEAQSSWSPNIALRLMMYLSDTYKEHIKRTRQDSYGSKPVSLPEPELYVLYSGEKEVPPEISMSQVHWGKDNHFLEVNVKVLRGGGDDILSQYLEFGEIYYRNRGVYGPTSEAVIKTIQECKEKGILTDYLTEREAEVMDIMTLLFDQETVTELYVESQKEIARDEGRKEGWDEGRKEEFDRVVEKLMKIQNLTREEAEAILL